MKKFKDWSLQLRLNSFQALSLFIILLVVGFLVRTYLYNEEKKAVLREIDLVLDRYTEAFETKYQNLAERFSRNAQLELDALPKPFVLDPGQKISVAGTETPLLKAGNLILNNRFEEVDRILRERNFVATFLARTADDFVRVTTNLKKEDGSRALGTFLTREHPAYKPVISGQTYIGYALLFGKDYLTYYQPLKDSSGNIIAIFFMGADISQQFQTLKEKLTKEKILDSGYYYVFNITPGNAYGRVLIHPRGLEGKDLFLERDADGKEFAREMAEKRNGITYYNWQNQGEKSAREKFVVFNHAPSLNWIVAGGAYSDDFNIAVRGILWITLLGSILLTLLIVGVNFFMNKGLIFKPLKEIALLANDLASGQADLRKRLSYTRANEIGEIVAPINRFIARIEDVVKRVKENVLTLSSAAVQISSSTEELAATSEEQSNQTGAIVNSIKELQTTSADIASTVDNSNREMQKSTEKVQQGSRVIESTITSLNEIEKRTANLASILSNLTQSAEKIGNIINVINEVAEQTNLLALNAAIEAARAGEAGRGFAVVADEVRKLAERTAKATQEIEEIISSLQNESRDAAQAMENALSEVKNGRQLGESSLKLLAEMNQSVEEVSQMLASIASAVTQENAAIEEIGQNVSGMGTAAQESASAIHQIAVSAEELAKQSDKLKSLSDEFVVS